MYYEYFIDFIPMCKLDAENMVDANFSKLGLDNRSSLVRMGSDGASVISNRVKCVNKWILHKDPYTYYVHCHRHKLNLVLIS